MDPCRGLLLDHHIHTGKLDTMVLSRPKRFLHKRSRSICRGVVGQSRSVSGPRRAPSNTLQPGSGEVCRLKSLLAQATFPPISICLPGNWRRQRWSVDPEFCIPFPLPQDLLPVVWYSRPVREHPCSLSLPKPSSHFGWWALGGLGIVSNWLRRLNYEAGHRGNYPPSKVFGGGSALYANTW